MRKRDCIEFLWDELKPFLPKSYTVDASIEILSILKQAKAMHKDESQKIFECGRNFQLTGEGTFEQVYNETFGGKQ